MRRVVTGVRPDGRSVFVSDEDVPPITLGNLVGPSFHRLWGDDHTPQLPQDGTPPSQHTYFPPAGGYRFGFFTLPPDGQPLPADFDYPSFLADADEKVPGMFEYNERENPGMHTTPTVDFEIVMSGQVVLELDDGAEVVLEPGDCVVQNGTRHAWHNRGTEPAFLFVALIGAVPPVS